MNQARLHELKDHYRHHLQEDVIPFWMKHSLDRTYGGFFNSLDQDGSVYDTDKAMWIQGRAVWCFAELYNALAQHEDWLATARHGYNFLTRHGFDTDGRMFFAVTRDGRPLRKRRYIFTESFGVIACSEYARAAGDEQALERAKATYRLILHLLRTPGALPPKVIPETRVTRSHSVPMILIATAQELRQADSDPLYVSVIDDALDQILNQFMKPDLRALLEIVGPEGERLNSAEGRRITPGHGFESSWFIMHEGLYRKDRSLIDSALNILDWALEWGWDQEYGGLFYFVDAEGKPSPRIDWDMKLWWPHAEALYALLLAYHLTGSKHYADWYETVHAWTFSHFPDPERGEWFGYLRRDGSIANRLKGGTWKGPFHVPRALLNCLLLLEKMTGPA